MNITRGNSSCLLIQKVANTGKTSIATLYAFLHYVSCRECWNMIGGACLSSVSKQTWKRVRVSVKQMYAGTPKHRCSKEAWTLLNRFFFFTTTVGKICFSFNFCPIFLIAVSTVRRLIRVNVKAIAFFQCSCLFIRDNQGQNSNYWRSQSNEASGHQPPCAVLGSASSSYCFFRAAAFPRREMPWITLCVVPLDNVRCDLLHHVKVGGKRERNEI